MLTFSTQILFLFSEYTIFSLGRQGKAASKHTGQEDRFALDKADVENRFVPGVVFDGMAVPAILPGGDGAAGDTGGGKGRPAVRVEEVGRGDPFIFPETGRGGPDQAALKHVPVRLHSAAVGPVKAAAGIGIGLKARRIAREQQALHVALHILRRYRFVVLCLPKEGGVGGNPAFLRRDCRLARVDFPLFLGAFFTGAFIDGGDFAALPVKKDDLFAGQAVFAGDRPAPKVRIRFVADHPFKQGEVVLEKVAGRQTGVYAEKLFFRRGKPLLLETAPKAARPSVDRPCLCGLNKPLCMP